MERVLDAIARARKALVPLIAAAYIVFGTENGVVVDVVSVLTALGVYAVPNRSPVA